MNRFYNLSPSFEFTYSLSDFDVITTKNYLEAVTKSINDIENSLTKLNLQKIALCLSGIDSEIIAHILSKTDIYTEFFFLKIDGINDQDLILFEKIAKKYNKNYNVISISVDQLIEEEIYKNFLITQVCWPTYVSIPSLIEKIPNDYYVILGEGDLEKTNNNKYSRIFNYKNIKYSEENFYVPVHLSETAYDRTLKFYNKKGESNFFSRSFDTWYHILRDKNLITDGKIYYDPKSNILTSIANENNLLSPIKTLNYNERFSNLKLEIIRKLIDKGNKQPGWHPYIGDIIVIPKSLLS